MSNENIGNNLDREVNLGNGQKTSMQVIQQIYKEVTGKSERLSRVYSVNHQTVFGDLESLNNRLSHIMEQYNVVQGGSAVIFQHIDDSSERFSSFDRARAYDAGSTIPIESINIEYDFLIILPVANKPEPYKVIVNLKSRAAVIEKSKEADSFEAQFLSLMASRTGMISIDYVDYAVARNIFREIDQWFGALHSSDTNRFVRLFKSKSHHFSWLLKYITATVLVFVFAGQLTIADHAPPLPALMKYGIICFGAIFVSSGLAGQAGSWCESLIDNYHTLSYLKMNRGDEKIISKFQKSTTLNLFMAAGSVILALIVNLVASWVAVKIGISK